MRVTYPSLHATAGVFSMRLLWYVVEHFVGYCDNSVTHTWVVNASRWLWFWHYFFALLQLQVYSPFECLPCIVCFISMYIYAVTMNSSPLFRLEEPARNQLALEIAKFNYCNVDYYNHAAQPKSV